jgi:Chlorophyllase enzyme
MYSETSPIIAPRVYRVCSALFTVSVIVGCSGSSDKNSASPNGGANSTTEGGSTTTETSASAGGASNANSNPNIVFGGSSSNGGATTSGVLPNGGRFTGTTPGGGRSGVGTSTVSTTTGGNLPQAGGTNGNGTDCAMGTWPTADPTATGPFATQTDNEVGPEAGVAAAGAANAPKFTMFRPKDMSQGGLCHPVITWGNGTSANPSMYKVLLNHLASHGFVVIASNSPNVAQGNPAPMIVGVTWVLEQNEDPSSVLYHRIDTTHIGATGHSQGAMATTQASSDSHIVVSVPIEGASVQKNLHGPAMFFCGGLDDIVGCNGAESAINAVTTLPAIYAEYLSVDHGSWMTFMGTKPSVVESAVTAWMRVHLMGDTALKPWFYGPTCKLCTDSGWKIIQKNMDP